MRVQKSNKTSSVYEKLFVKNVIFQNPSTCTFENGKYLKKVLLMIQ